MSAEVSFVSMGLLECSRGRCKPGRIQPAAMLPDENSASGKQGTPGHPFTTCERIGFAVFPAAPSVGKHALAHTCSSLSLPNASQMCADMPSTYSIMQCLHAW